MYTDKPERERAKIEQAQIDLDVFIKVVVGRQTGYSQLMLGLTPWTFSHVIGAYFNRFMITDKKFTVDSDTCTHCGRCARECPVGDIVFDGIPTWRHDGRCTTCLSCYHHCPVHAINYGQITHRRGQYYFGHRQ
jgi:NAD-dependent dihydropyrimidine dehydrogenase PreA subunit